MNAKMIQILRTILGSRFLPLLIIVLAAIPYLPALEQGPILDDFIHRFILFSSSFSSACFDLFAFISPDKVFDFMNAGILPWWTLPTLHISFFRPLTSLTHWLDYQFWPDSFVFMHLQNILWYIGICIIVTLIYRRIFQKAWVAGLAALIFTLDFLHLTPVVWIASRNVLLALFFGLLTLVTHHTWCRKKGRSLPLLAPFYFLLSILSAETGAATLAYLVSYTIFLNTSPWRQRLRHLIPYVLVLNLWWFFYQYLGFGVHGSGVYSNPLEEPLRFIIEVLKYGPMLIMDQWLGVNPAIHSLLSASALKISWCFALIFTILLGFLLVPLIRTSQTARFWATGMSLSVLLPCTVNVPDARHLAFTGIGAAALLAMLLRAVYSQHKNRPTHRAWQILARSCCIILIALHLIVPPVLLPSAVKSANLSQKFISQFTDIGYISKKQTAIIINAPSPFSFVYFTPLNKFNQRPIPGNIRVLAPGWDNINITRIDQNTLNLKPANGYFSAPGRVTTPEKKSPHFHIAYILHQFDKLFRKDSSFLKLGQQINLTGINIRILSQTKDHRPSEVQFQFEQSLENPNLVWFYWDRQNGCYQKLKLPEIGETIDILGLLE